MSSMGERLKAERLRLGLSAEKFSALTGMHRNAQYRYEANERLPDTGYLQAAYEAGVDIFFVVTGQYLTTQLAPDESLLLMDYRSLSPQGKVQASVAVRQLGLSSNTPPPAVDAPAHTPADAARAALEQAGVKVKGDVGNINTGPVDQSNMTMIVGRRARVIKRDDKK
ncbi:helix-turn-helix domain-containing protein [Laribacter hongkongensis]|uniref:helix-turn-helix domain-containing protein n=2 Tax=Laribacter hongkongensis TaxID=168471 RepID=UPI001EFEE3AF|nr:helix-turn-helix transcriptional regulator [Laribacter hongkongensis]MCG8998419.1 helix-turn-helix domain-containing protein [Laribacter hongkongensis]MCG9013588.1 helix-turn-helix domain-containing protein [Laribacter hongkongensis]